MVFIVIPNKYTQFESLKNLQESNLIMDCNNIKQHG